MPGDVVLLMPATYLGSVVLPSGVELRGHGPRASVLIVSDEEPAVTFHPELHRRCSRERGGEHRHGHEHGHGDAHRHDEESTVGGDALNNAAGAPEVGTIAVTVAVAAAGAFDGGTAVLEAPAQAPLVVGTHPPPTVAAEAGWINALPQLGQGHHRNHGIDGAVGAQGWGVEVDREGEDWTGTSREEEDEEGLPLGLVTNMTLWRQSAFSSGTLGGAPPVSCVLVCSGTLRLDSCNVVSVGEGLVAVPGAHVKVSACDISAVLSGFIASAGSLCSCVVSTAQVYTHN